MPDQSENLGSTDDRSVPRELNTGPGGVGLTEPHTEPATPPRRLRFYVAALLLAPFCYLAACLLVMRSDLFLKRTQNVYVANMGYGLKLKDADCQVLIYGDSSAMVGVDPDTVKVLTHLTVCNIADFAGMLRVNGTMVLDEYLAHNKRPQYLVVMLAREDLAAAWRHDGNFEAVLMRIRRKPDLAFLRTVVLHPDDMLSAIGIGGRFALTWMIHKPLSLEVRTERELTHGRFPDPKETLVNCPDDTRVNPPDRNWTDGLRARYGIDGTHVLVDVTPVPICDPGLALYERELPAGNGIIDNQLHTYPVGWYTQSGRLHMGAEGVRHLSEEVADQINQAAQANGAQPVGEGR